MQKYFITILTIIAVVITGCSKDDQKPEIKTGINFKQFEFKSFASSDWKHVAGGKVFVEIKSSAGQTSTVDS